MANASGKQGSKNASKGSSGGSSSGGGSVPAMPGSGATSSLMGSLNKKKKPFLGMPAPLGYVPGLGRG